MPHLYPFEQLARICRHPVRKRAAIHSGVITVSPWSCAAIFTLARVGLPPLFQVGFGPSALSQFLQAQPLRLLFLGGG
jgi:hypothetical protein